VIENISLMTVQRNNKHLCLMCLMYVMYLYKIFLYWKSKIEFRAVVIVIVVAISAYSHCSCEFKSCSWWGVLDTKVCDKVCQWLAGGRLCSPGTSTIKTDCHNISEILLKVTLNPIILTQTQDGVHLYKT